MNLEQAREAAQAAVRKAEEYRSFEPHSWMVQQMLNGDARAALKIFETAIIIERAAREMC